MGFRSFGTPHTRLRFAGNASWLDGDVEVSPGVGLVGRQSSRLLLDSQRAGRALDYHLYRHAALTPGLTLASIADLSAAGAHTIDQLEVHCGVPPGAGTDALNHFTVDVSGAFSGSISLPLDVAGQASFSLDLAAPVFSLGVDIAGASKYGGAINGSNHIAGSAWAIQPDADTTLVALAFPVSLGAGIVKRAFIADANRQVLAEVSDDRAWDRDGDVRVELPYQVELSQGETYIVGWEAPDEVFPGVTGEKWIRASGGKVGWTNAGAIVAREDDQISGPPAQKLTLGSKDGQNVGYGILDGAIRDDVWNAESPLMSEDGSATIPCWFGYSKATGVVLSGDLTVSVSEVGAGSTAPAELNIALLARQ